VDLEFGLQLADPPLRRGEFVALDRRQARDKPAIDALLASPGIDRPVADPEIASDVDDLAPGTDEIDHASTELGRVTPSSHGCLLSRQRHDVQLPDFTKGRADHPLVTDVPAFSLVELRAAGFVGFVTVAQLRAGACGPVPTQPGIYVVLRASDAPPRFLAHSPAGWFKGVDPTESISILRARWVPDTPLIYVGKATAGSQRRRHLRKRLAELIDFGAGRPIGHRGGRYLWQIEDSDGFLVAWRQDGNPAAAENEVLRTFAGTHGSFPFANIAGPRG
jgi:hypothetical protein